MARRGRIDPVELVNPGNAVPERIRAGRSGHERRSGPGGCRRILLAGIVSWAVLFAIGPTNSAAAAQDAPLVLEPERAQSLFSDADVALLVGSPLGEPEQTRSGAPSLWTEAALLVGGTFVYTALHPHVRPRIAAKGSLANIRDNFTDPIGRAVRGVDRDPFFVNYVTHPVTWGGMTGVLRARGHSTLEAFALSQGHSIFWEYVVEGSYTSPSGRDMVTNFVSAAVEAFVLHPLLFD